MRINLNAILVGLLLSVLSPCGFLTTQAQDALYPGTEVDVLGVDKETEKNMYSPGDLDPAFKKAQSAASRDSVASRNIPRLNNRQAPDASKAPVKRPAEEDDSILSFNFLYYIFQKYKMQDVVD